MPSAKTNIMKKLTTLLIILLSWQILAAQKQANIWYFGEYAGLDFNSGTPIAITNSVLNIFEGGASICDSSGNLLFYTDGIVVIDSSHNQMPNGFGLPAIHNPTQGAVIVPKPNSDFIYYIFTGSASGGEQGECGCLAYSIVDMTLNNGKGDIISKNNILHVPITEHLAAINHKNGNDIWVLTHEYGSNNIIAYLVTSSGVIQTPTISKTGNVLPAGGWGQSAHGAIRFSPKGCKVALTYLNRDTLQVFNFDSEWGVVYNPITIPIEHSWGVCFSQNGNILYAGNGNSSQLFQYDLSIFTESAINSSKTLIANMNEIDQLQNGPDGKIYIAKLWKDYLGVINNPNELGIGCNFVDNAIYLDGKINNRGLPNFIQSYFNTDTTTNNCSELYIKCLPPEASFIYTDSLMTVEFTDVSTSYFTDSLNTVYFSNSTTSIYNWYWDFGDSTIDTVQNPVHSYDSAGTYYVCLIVTNSCGSDTFCNNITITCPLPKAAFTFQDADLEVNFTNTSINAISFYWDFGDNIIDTVQNSVHSYDSAGTYHVCLIATNLCGSNTFCNNITITCPLPEAAFTFQDADLEVNFINTSTNAISFYWEFGDSTINTLQNPVHSYDSAGTYAVQLIAENECGKDTAYLDILVKFEFDDTLTSDIIIYNTFTPNNDNVNDTWHIENIDLYPNNSVEIYNRNGNLVFKENNYQNKEWNGKYNNHNFPAATYYYIIILDKNIEKITGVVTIIR